MTVSGLFNIVRKHNDVSLQSQMQWITMAGGESGPFAGGTPGVLVRWGRVPCEENDGRTWLPLGCIVALEWLVDAKHGVMAWVRYCTRLYPH